MAGTLTVGTVSDGTNSTSATDVIKGSAKAWVNFNGIGTVAIRASHNVSSITDNGIASYTINFTTPMPDTNYVYAASGEQTSTATGVVTGKAGTTTIHTDYLSLSFTGASNNTYYDMISAMVVVFR